MAGLRHEGFRAHLPSGDKRLGLTTKEEQAWCRWYGAEAWDGRGVIVEWGAWLGSLTINYCEGLVLNPARAERGPILAERGPIAYAYDLFRWEEWCEEQVQGTEHAGKLTVGAPFDAYFRELHRAYADFLDVRRADLAAVGWDGPPIQLIVNDAVKTLPIGANVFRRFLPALLPEIGLIANQDYLWPTDAFLTLLMYQARDFFDFEFTLPDSCMVIFRCRRAFDPAVVDVPATLAEVDPALFAEAFAWSRRRVQVVPPAMIDLGHAVTLWQGGFRDHASRLARDRRLGTKNGSPMYDFQLDVLRSWGYGELLA
jgi:hypothetical protein